MTLMGIALMDRKLGNIWLEGFKWEMRNWRQKTMNNPFKQVSWKECDDVAVCQEAPGSLLRQD